jgi:hypothetical protein
MSSISSAHDPRAGVCQSSAPARRNRWRIHWSPRKSPRDIFSCFFLGAAYKRQPSCLHFSLLHRAGQEAAGDACFSAPYKAIVPMIAV